MGFTLGVPSKEIAHWAGRYGYDDQVAVKIGERVRKTARLSYHDFLALAGWKTQRSKSRCRQNRQGFVVEVVRHALATTEPRFKIEVLRLLDGVEWATASVILHFCDRDRWPILDVRAFWSLGQAPPSHVTYSLWEAYVEATRVLADRHAVSMRTLDRALWAYSDANQGRLARH